MMSYWITCHNYDTFCYCFVSDHFADIRAEMMPDSLPDRSEVTQFDSSKLKHVVTNEKVIIPSKEGTVKC